MAINENVKAGKFPFTIPKGRFGTRKDSETNLMLFGNVTSLTINQEVEDAEALITMDGPDEVGDNSVVKQTFRIQGTCNTPNKKAVQTYFSAKDSAPSTVAASSVAAGDYVADLGRIIELGFRNVSAVVVKDSTEVTTYTLGDDYIVEPLSGRITFTEDGAIADAEALKISFSYAETTTTKFLAGSEFAQDLHFDFQGAPIKGKIFEVKGFGTARATGPFQLVSNEHLTFDFEIVAKTHEDYESPVEIYDHGERIV